MTQIDISKAGSQISGLISAVGLEQAWGAVSSADEQTLSSDERDAVMREMATLQLGKASELVKMHGLTPEVVQLLQMLINLMAGSPGLAPGQPAAGTPEDAPQAEPAEMAAEPAAKELPPALEQSAAPHADPPEGLPDGDEGKVGQTAEGEPDYDAVGKDLPAEQRDPMPSQAQSDAQPSQPRSTNVTGGSANIDDKGDADPLPAELSEPPVATPQRDAMPSTPTRKAAEVQKDARTGLPKGGGWWNQRDIGKATKDNPLMRRPNFRKTTATG